MAGPPPNMDLLWSLGQTGDRYPLKETFTRGDQTYKREFEATTQPTTSQPATSQPAGKTATSQPAADGPALPPGAAASVMPPATPVPPRVQYVPPAFDAADPAWTEGVDDRIAAGQEGAADAGVPWDKIAQYGMPLAMMALMGLMNRGKKGGGGGGMAMLPLMMMLPQMMQGFGGGGTGGSLPATLRGA